MSINVYEARFQHVSLFGKDVLCTDSSIARDDVPNGWHCYDLQDTISSPGQPMELVDTAVAGRVYAVLSPVSLKRPSTSSRKIGGTFFLHHEEWTLAKYCKEHGLECPTNNRIFSLRPASSKEAGLFYALPPEEDEALGAIGHVRIDFGYGGREFWHTWHARGPQELNCPEFREELDSLVNELREYGPLKNYAAMCRYCADHGGAIEGGWTQNYGFIVETERYRYCLRCNPSPGDYQCYLNCFDKQIQKIRQSQAPSQGMKLGGM